MGKKVREYKSGDFIFAKVKGYPAWPARVQRPNGKKYFVYFYGTSETANLPPNMIFDYAENKTKFLTKSVKRRDFNEGVKQIEYDFANNVPLEDVIGVPVEAAVEAPGNDTADDSALDATLNDSAADTTANDTVADDANATQNDAVVEDSDDAGALVIDEGKTPTAKGRKSKAESKSKETPKPKEPKTPRGRPKKEEAKEKEDDAEELTSRSGRKIRPKRYIDEQTEENTTLPSPAPKRRRAATPSAEKETANTSKETASKDAASKDAASKDAAPKDAAPKEAASNENETDNTEYSVTQFNVVKQTELEGLKEIFKPAEEDKENILIAYLSNGAYAGIRLFRGRPTFKTEASRLLWEKQAARLALALKINLERQLVTPESVKDQLVLDLNLTDEEKATLDKERETEEKKSRVNFLKTEMKLIELDAKIKTCLCLEKADTELCLKLLDDLIALEVKPLMLLKHPTCLETVKRMRAYVGNTPSWDLNETDALAFSKQAHKIRKKADHLYKNMKEHFQPPDGMSFWEYFSERVIAFKKATSQLSASELLELVHEPTEPQATQPVEEEANKTAPAQPEATAPVEEDKQNDKKAPAAKSKKAPPTPAKKRRETRGKKEEEPTEAEAQPEESAEDGTKKSVENGEGEKSVEEAKETEKEAPVEPVAENAAKDTNEDVEMAEPKKAPESEEKQTEKQKETKNDVDVPEEGEAKKSKTDKPKDAEKPTEKSTKKDKKAKEASEKSETSESSKGEEKAKDKEVVKDKKTKDSKESSKHGKESEKDGVKEKKDVSEDKSEKEEDKDSGEPRAKRSRETKKTEPPSLRSPAKRKSKN